MRQIHMFFDIAKVFALSDRKKKIQTFNRNPWLKAQRAIEPRALNNDLVGDVLRGVCNQQQHNMQLRSALDLEHFQWQGVDDEMAAVEREREREIIRPSPT